MKTEYTKPEENILSDINDVVLKIQSKSAEINNLDGSTGIIIKSELIDLWQSMTQDQKDAVKYFVDELAKRQKINGQPVNLVGGFME